MSVMSRRKRRGGGAGGGGGHGMPAIVPMIDMLVTLVLYMLVHQADYQIVPAPGMKMPQSTADKSPHETTTMMITKEMIFVNSQAIVSVAEADANVQSLAKLTAALQAETHKKNLFKSNDPSAREVTVVADKSLPYSLLKKIMNTAMVADVGKLSLAVVEKGGAAAGSSPR